MTGLPQSNRLATLTFNVTSPLKVSQFGPRIGNIKLCRPEDSVAIQTPTLVVWTSRGVVPHLSRDHYRITEAIRWVHIPFESFLEYSPPVPTLQTGLNPLHRFLGYLPSRHILSMSVRDPSDCREMPSNGNDYISAQCIRGVRKVKPFDWRSYVLACRPDVVIALSDSPFTKPPYSQKRLTKSIERSTSWVADMLRPIEATGTSSSSHSIPHSLSIFVHMAGGTSPAARAAFAEGLTEILHDKEAENVKPLKCLDDGVAGYVFDLVPLYSSLLAEENQNDSTLRDVEVSINGNKRPCGILPLMEASLISLPSHKPRLVNSAASPHEILRLIQHIGIDLFDVHWAQSAADIGIALDFHFPVSAHILASAEFDDQRKTRKTGLRDLGHNLFDPIYADDFSKLADSFLDGFSASIHSDRTSGPNMPVCPCAACSPVEVPTNSWRDLDAPLPPNSSYARPRVAEFLPPFTRAYIHHLLQTHEMTSHGLLTMHNLEVLNAFFAGVRAVLALPDGTSRFSTEVAKFGSVYDEDMLVFDEARVFWSEVDKARGKGRLGRARDTSVDPSPKWNCDD